MMVKIVLFLTIIFVCGCAATAGHRSKTFKVENYGALADGVTDCAPAINKAISDAIMAGEGSVVAFDSGRYKVGSKINLTDAKGLVVNGKGNKTQIIFTNFSGGFHMENCADTFLKDIAIDFDPLPFTQGKVVAVNPNDGTFDIDIQQGFDLLNDPRFEEGMWGVSFDPEKPHLAIGVPDHIFIRNSRHLGGRLWRLTAEGGYNDVRRLQPGDRYAQLATRGGNGVVITGSRDCLVKNISIYSSPCMGTLLAGNEGRITISGLRVLLKPESGRFMTLNGDGVHCVNNRVGPTIENCYFEAMADDSINIHGMSFTLKKVYSPTKLEIVSDYGDKILKGDRLQIFDVIEGLILGEVVVSDIKAGQVTLAEPIEALTDNKGAEDLTERIRVYNLSGSGEGYVICNNRMFAHRQMGIRMRTGNGIIEGNSFEQLGGCGIMLRNGPVWKEGPLAENVLIRNNRFVDLGLSQGFGDALDRTGELVENYVGAIQIMSGRTGERRWPTTLAKGRGQRNIVIEDNEFINSPGSAVAIGSASGVLIKDNVVRGHIDAKPWRKAAVISLTNCDHIVIDGLKITDKRPETIAAIEIDQSVSAGLEGVHITNTKSIMNEKSVKTIDKRKPQENQ